MKYQPPFPRLTPEPAPIENAKWISLTQGRFALIDEKDYERVNQRNWCYDKPYAIATINKKKAYLHRFILNISDPNIEIDHINRNKLDARFCNLRICDTSQNHGNVGLIKTNTSGYKGVSWNKKAKKYKVQIKVKDKPIHLGMFHNVEEAARAYDEAAIKYFGEFACTNASLKGES